VTSTVLAYIPSPPRGVWHLGPLSALFIIVGIIGALMVGSWLWDTRGRPRSPIQAVALWAAPLGVVVAALALAYVAGSVDRLWILGPVPIRAYAFCILLGILVALIIGDRRWVARGGEPGVIYDIALWAVPFGLIGGRLYHVMTDWPKYFGPEGLGFAAALKIWDGGLGIWGAVALGGIGAWIACRRRGIPLPAFGDAIAPGIVLAQAIGRLGNYFNQELYGRATTLPWGLEVFERRDAAGAIDPLNGVATGPPVAVVHPTFLYELLWNVLVFAVLIWVDRRFRIGHGRLFALYVAAYCAGRFWIELMRSDFASEPIGGIRVNTLTSTFVFIGAVVYIMVAPKGRENPATLKGNAVDGTAEQSRLDELGEELVAVAATSGVVAAAKVAGEEDEHETAAAAAEPEKPDEPQSDVTEPEGEKTEPEEGLGSVEGDEAVDAVAAAPEVHEAAVAGAEEAESVAEEVGAEAEPEPAEPEPAESESAESDVAKPEEGLGSVEGDEVVGAVADAPEVHEAAVAGAEEAELVADEVAAEAEPEAEAAEPDVAEAEPEPAESESAESEPAESDSDEPDVAKPEEGLGSVEGDEVVEAQGDASEVHEAAVEGAEEAESVAEEVAAEAESEAAEPEAAEPDVAEAEGEESEPAEAESEPAESEAAESDSDETDVAKPEEGLGSVEGDEIVEAQGDASEVHEAAVEGAEEAESVAEKVAAEAEPEAASKYEPSTAPPRRRWWSRRG
jgi:prolipoprotein diacylglyceryl transferase